MHSNTRPELGVYLTSERCTRVEENCKTKKKAVFSRSRDKINPFGQGSDRHRGTGFSGGRCVAASAEAIGARSITVFAAPTRACGRARVSIMNLTTQQPPYFACDVLFGFGRDGCSNQSQGNKRLVLPSVPGTGKRGPHGHHGATHSDDQVDL